jgi:hypothetical protein
VGRKSRAKAVRRAERSRVLVSPPSSPSAPVAGPFATWPKNDLGTTLARPAAPAVARTPGSTLEVARLRLLVARQREVQRQVEDEVRRLLVERHSWTVLGEALGLSRQGARQRYRRLLTDESETAIGTDPAG